MQSEDKILTVKNLNVIIDGGQVLKDISFNVNEGDVLAIIGPNGAGKTTLFKALLGLLPYEGEIIWKQNIKLGYVPQRIEIEKNIPITVKEFFELNTVKINKQEIDEVLNRVQLDKEILKMGLGEISIGQRQRLFIAWSVLNKPDIILFDEPTADVDIYGQQSIYQMLLMLREKLNLTVIFISHELNVVASYANKVMCLNHINVCTGKPEEILKPEMLQKLYGEEKGFYQHKH